MNKLLLFVAALFLTSCASPRSGFEEAGFIVKGRRVGSDFEGRVEIWTNPRVLQSVGHAENGVPHGEWRTYDSKGILTAHYHFNRGVLNGPVALYYGSWFAEKNFPEHVGKIKLRGNLLNGQYNGKVVRYEPNGTIEHERQYRSGSLISCTLYHPNSDKKVTDEQATHSCGEAAHKADMKYLFILADVAAKSLKHGQHAP